MGADVDRAQDIVDAIDALIEAKLSGASDVKEFARKNLASLGSDIPSSIDALMKLRDKYARIAAYTSANLDEGTIFVVEE